MQQAAQILRQSSAKLGRRQFLGAAAAATLTIVPRHVLGGPGQTPPSDKLNIAGVGVGGAWRIWDGETFALRKTLKREGDRPYRHSFALGGALLFWKQNGQLVTPVAANRLLTWDVEQGEVVAEVDIPELGFFAVSPDGSEIVTYPITIGGGERVNFLEAATGKSLRRSKDRGKSSCEEIGISPEGGRIVTNGAATVWDGNTGQPVCRNTKAWASDPLWQPSGGLIAARKRNNPRHELSMFDAVTMGDAFNLKGEGKGVSCHAWSPDGILLAAADIDNAIRVWDISKREVISNLVGHQAAIRKLAWAPDGKRLASRSDDKTVRLWDPVSGESQRMYDEFPESMHTHKFDHGLAWTPDGQRLWIALGTHAVKLDVATGQFSPMEDFSNGNVITSLAVSPDGHLLAREMSGWTFLRTIGADGSPSRRLLGHGLGLYSVWHPDSRRFLGDEKDGLGGVVTFDIQTNRRLGTLFPWITGDHWMCVSPEGPHPGRAFRTGSDQVRPGRHGDFGVAEGTDCVRRPVGRRLAGDPQPRRIRRTLRLAERSQPSVPAGPDAVTKAATQAERGTNWRPSLADFSRLPVCHQLQLVGSRCLARHSRL